MVLFLETKLEMLVCSSYERFLRKEVLLEANTDSKLVEVDINDKNLVLLHKVDLGFGIKSKLM